MEDHMNNAEKINAKTEELRVAKQMQDSFLDIPNHIRTRNPPGRQPSRDGDRQRYHADCVQLRECGGGKHYGLRHRGRRPWHRGRRLHFAGEFPSTRENTSSRSAANLALTGRLFPYLAWLQKVENFMIPVERR
jgi:hypothetical protein